MPNVEQRGQLVTVRALSKTFRSQRGQTVALETIDLDIVAGEFLSIIGPSGCGKSTLLKIIAGLVPFDSGTLQWAWDRNARKGQDIGFVFQEPVLLPWKTVLDNARFPLDLFGWPKQRSDAIIKDLLQRVGLQGFERALPRELSGGMRQRVAIVRALAYDPQLLLMDEPFGALDMLTRERLNDELLQLWSQRPQTVVFVTHSVDEAVYLSDRVVVMTPRPGRIAQIFPIALPRPRTTELREDQRFIRYVQQLREWLGSKDVVHP